MGNIVFCDLIDEGKAKVNRIIFNVDGLDIEQLSKEGLYRVVNFIPEPDRGLMTRDRKAEVMYIDLTNDTIFYEYVDKPLTPEEELQKLKEQLQLMQKAMDDMLMNKGGL